MSLEDRMSFSDHLAEMKKIELDIARLEAQISHRDIINLSHREARGEKVSGKITAAFKRHRRAIQKAEALS